MTLQTLNQYGPDFQIKVLSSLLTHKEFLSNIYAAGPKSQSTITAATQPQTSPLAQSIGAGLGAFTAFQGFGNNQGS